MKKNKSKNNKNVVKNKVQNANKKNINNTSIKNNNKNKNVEKTNKKQVKNKIKSEQSNFNIGEFYKKSYKKLLIIPFVLFLFSCFVIFQTVQTHNSPILRDISLKGGLSSVVEVSSSTDPSQLSNILNEKFPNNDFSVSQMIREGENAGYIIDTDLSEEKLILELNNIFETQIIQGENYNSNYISPTLSNAFFKQAVYILIISFVLMSLVVFIYFRELVPSSIIVLSAVFDIIVTVALLNLFGIKISIAGIGALLMLIGYSIDTDVLLTNRLIKEKDGDDYFEKTYFAFKTGLLMTLTTLIAGVATIILSFSEVITQIAVILVIGLIVDFISTWIQNSGILLWWLEKKQL
ncbi:MAG: hypothetical protein ACOC16_02815 [Nanoarchaeota archaeon]